MPKCVFALCLWLMGSAAFAQNLLPNPGFEEGTDVPDGWKLSGGAGAWSTAAHEGKRCVMVEGDGKGSSQWRTEKLALTGGGIYRLSFAARQDAGATGGCAIAGLSRVNRDFRLTDTWQRYSFVFSVPEDGTNDYLRFGQWECKGRCYFDDVELYPVQAGMATEGGQGQLGDGESIEGGIYRFQPNFAWEGANFHNTLWHNRTTFNSDRWVFSPGSELVYRFLIKSSQTAARVGLNINNYLSGKLVVEASADATSWLPVQTCQGRGAFGWTNLPAKLFPAREIFLRFSLAGEGNLQVNSLGYEAQLDEFTGAAQGKTTFMDVLQRDANVQVILPDFSTQQKLRQASATFLVLSADTNLHLYASATNCLPFMSSGAEVTITEGIGGFRVCAQLPDAGEQTIYWRVADQTNRTVFLGRSEAKIGFLYDSRPGYELAGKGNVGLWWAESGWKLAKDVIPPKAGVRPVSISAAKGEYEAAQIVLSPHTNGPANSEELVSAKVGVFKNSRGGTAPIDVRINELGYVHVTHPTDEVGQRDWYPDPLPPLKLPMSLRPGENKTLWLTFHVPDDAKAGDYTSELTLQLSSGKISVPLSVHVYDFALPRESHLRSALGLGTHEINRYHNLTASADKRAVYEKYLQNFAEHRISPYSFFDYAPIDIRFTGPKTNRQARVDFTQFDKAAAKWLGGSSGVEHPFNAFQLPLRGMGGGRFQSRRLGELDGFKEGTPEFARLFGDYLGQIETHLRQKGWLDKAFTYWFDEPDQNDYQFVVDGMARIKTAAPGIRRMLTEQPEPELEGNVDIWCGLTPQWTREKMAERRKAGDEVWWYICCIPHAPYVTEFIDHPGTEMRLWPWQSWQYDVRGILIWATTYWSSSSAFPPPKMEDPWEDPMSYVSGYDFGEGRIGYWGNGDGRFLYPPQRAPGTNQPACLDAPINSIRWENLRDGMEDYEYFWLLKERIARAEKAGADKVVLEQARRLLEIPEEISKDLTHFTKDPRLMLQHRDKVARMIERLK